MACSRSTDVLVDGSASYRSRSSVVILPAHSLPSGPSHSAAWFSVASAIAANAAASRRSTSRSLFAFPL
eukprot:7390993-Prymnesium_polylepis.1